MFETLIDPLRHGLRSAASAGESRLFYNDILKQVFTRQQAVDSVTFSQKAGVWTFRNTLAAIGRPGM
jgi:hypothetical protein